MNTAPTSDFFDHPVIYPNEAFRKHQGVGMTSQRTRNRLVQRLIDLGVEDQQVLRAIQATPRHLFVDEAMATRSYEDTALPIGFGQTISQPRVVAEMSAWLFKNGPLTRVMEVGTGSGYQTAILAQLAKHVYSVERIEPLLNRAIAVLQRLQLDNVQFALSDGHWGWPYHAPFDGMISAASPEQVPEELLEQLTEGGRLVMPIGGQQQELFGFIRTSTGYKQQQLGEVMFVPMKTGLVSEAEAQRDQNL